jgi:lactoylglutathione lyase
VAQSPRREALFRKLDCIQLPVPDLDAAIAFYRGRLGHEVLWRRETSAGLQLPETDAELVLQTEREEGETDILVASADAAAEHFTRSGGRVVEAPFDIEIGRCAVVEDPWGNRLVLLDMTKGPLVRAEVEDPADGIDE